MSSKRLGTKQRPQAHIMESESLPILKRVLPSEWVLREYRPDYGIDLALEIFSPPSEEGPSETLGEHIFIQLKSTKILTKRQHTVKFAEETVAPGVPMHRPNVESIDIECAAFVLETAELRTVEIMGSAVVVLLILVEESTQSTFFICLNDYIDKVLNTENPGWRNQGSNTIYIPLRNRLSVGNKKGLASIGFYAKRGKVMAAFQQFTLQSNELNWWLKDIQRVSEDPEDAFEESVVEACRFALHNSRYILRWDFWWQPTIWQILPHSAQQLQYVEKLLATWGEPFVAESIPKGLVASPESGWQNFNGYLDQLSHAELRAEVLQRIGILWDQLANLPRIYEQVCRRWMLPIFDGYLLSDPGYQPL